MGVLPRMMTRKCQIIEKPIEWSCRLCKSKCSEHNCLYHILKNNSNVSSCQMCGNFLPESILYQLHFHLISCHSSIVLRDMKLRGHSPHFTRYHRSFHHTIIASHKFSGRYLSSMIARYQIEIWIDDQIWDHFFLFSKCTVADVWTRQ